MPCGQNTKEILFVSVYVCDCNKLCSDSLTSVTIECPQNDTASGIADVANGLQVEISKRNFQRSLALAGVIMKTFKWGQHISSLELSKRQAYLLCSKAAINTLEYYSRSLFRVPYLINEVFDVLNDVMNIFSSATMSCRIKASLHRLITVMIELLEEKQCRKKSPFVEFWRAWAGTGVFTRPGHADCYSLSERKIEILLNVYELLTIEMVSYESCNNLANIRDNSEALFKLMLTSVDTDYHSNLMLSTSTASTTIYTARVYTSVLNNELFKIHIRLLRPGHYYALTELKTCINSWLCGKEVTCHLHRFNVFIHTFSSSTFPKKSDLKKASLDLVLSPIVHLKMWTSDNNLESELNNRSIKILFQSLTRVKKVDTLQCVTWNINLWEATPCLNVKLINGNIECNCPIMKYIGVFRTSEKKNEPSTVELNSRVLKDLITEAVQVTLGFNATIKEEAPEIESHIRYQLASILEVEESRIMNLVLISDLKVVTFVIKLEHSSRVLSRLEDLVRNKELRLVDQDGNLVEVVPHLFFVKNVFLPSLSENKTKYGTIIYILVALLLVVSFLICNIITLKKKMKRCKRIGVRSIPTETNSVFTRHA
ncbi:uncharacterized protein LOC111088986 [Limulus polyphemus]|uniref:Uncharacterized protein LOC111088986 n=1 Tax=Limulus polyphemus TaxID=6850 RepID=A0ABM1TJZ0_LIMPO|nr:uncharacterized protein LOC111088986 [Limulus polyphemus]